MDKKALIVIDMQNDYLWEKKKPMFTYNTDKLVSDVNRTIETYLAQDCDIIYIKHVLSRLMWCVGATAKGAAKTGIKVKLIEASIGRRFPEDKIRRMRSDLKVLGVEYI